MYPKKVRNKINMWWFLLWKGNSKYKYMIELMRSTNKVIWKKYKFSQQIKYTNIQIPRKSGNGMHIPYMHVWKIFLGETAPSWTKRQESSCAWWVSVFCLMKEINCQQFWSDQIVTKWGNNQLIWSRSISIISWNLCKT